MHQPIPRSQALPERDANFYDPDPGAVFDDPAEIVLPDHGNDDLDGRLPGGLVWVFCGTIVLLGFLASSWVSQTHQELVDEAPPIQVETKSEAQEKQIAAQ